MLETRASSCFDRNSHKNVLNKCSRANTTSASVTNISSLYHNSPTHDKKFVPKTIMEYNSEKYHNTTISEKSIVGDIILS